MRKARSNASKHCAASSSIRKSPSTAAASSRPPATACWWNLPASSMRFAVRSRCSRQCPSGTPAPRQTNLIELRIGINLGGFATPAPPVLPLPSIAALPFQNMSDDGMGQKSPAHLRGRWRNSILLLLEPILAKKAVDPGELPLVVGDDGIAE